MSELSEQEVRKELKENELIWRDYARRGETSVCVITLTDRLAEERRKVRELGSRITLIQKLGIFIFDLQERVRSLQTETRAAVQLMEQEIKVSDRLREENLRLDRENQRMREILREVKKALDLIREVI